MPTMLPGTIASNRPYCGRELLLPLRKGTGQWVGLPVVILTILLATFLPAHFPVVHAASPLAFAAGAGAAGAGARAHTKSATSAEVTVDAGKTLGPLPALTPNLSEPGFPGAVAPAVQALGTHLIRLDHILDTEVQRDRNGQLVYDFTDLDNRLAGLRFTGAEPLLVLSYLPPALQVNGDPYGPPNSLSDWRAVVQRTVQHVNIEKGYHVRYWEVWNEPDTRDFWHGSLSQYLQFYDAAAAGGSAADPTIKIGGPAEAYVAHPVGQSFTHALLDHAAATGARLDFVSWHVYGDSPYYVNGKIITQIAAAAYTLQLVRSFVPAALRSRVELFIDEWNLYGHNKQDNNITDTNVGAAYIAAFLGKVIQAGLGEPAFHLNYFRLQDSNNPAEFWGDQGLITNSGTHKAAYNAFVAFEQLQPIQVQTTTVTTDDTIGAVASKNPQTGVVTLLLWNWHATYRQECKGKVEINCWNFDDPAVAVHLNVGHLPVTRNLVTIYSIDAHSSNAFAYRDNPAQKAAHQDLEQIGQVISGASGAATVQMEPYSVRLLTFTPAPALTGLSRTWYFAEGRTTPGFEEFLAVLNPNNSPAHLALTYYLEDGTTLGDTLTVPPQARGTTKVNTVVGANHQVGARVVSDVPVLVDRPLTFSFGVGSPTPITGGLVSPGATELSQSWYFAAGSTTPGFQEFLALLNPNTAPALLTVTYFLASGPPVVRDFAVSATSRYTINLSDPVEGPGPGQVLGIQVSADAPVLAERFQFFQDQQTNADGTLVLPGAGAQVGSGAKTLGTGFRFAEADPGTDAQELLAILNPGPLDAQVQVQLPAPESPVTINLLVPHQSRGTLLLHDPTSPATSVAVAADITGAHFSALAAGNSDGNPNGLPPGRNGPAGIIVVTSTNGVPLAVERPIYRITTGSAATPVDAQSSPQSVQGSGNLPSTAYTAALAEGYTSSSNNELLLISNPGTAPAYIVTFFYLDPTQAPGSAESRPLTRLFRIPPQTRRTLQVADIVGKDRSVSAAILSDVPISVEQREAK